MSENTTTNNPVRTNNKCITTTETFTDFRRLKNNVSSLISARSYLENESSQASVDAIIELAKKIEISNYVQSDDFIAVAGMQGTGKTTIISCLYDLPVGLLDISIGRSERIPVFISEDINLEDRKYRAERVSVDKDTGTLFRDEISAESIAAHSKGVNATAFVELFVPARYNAKFVLLPGFEKDENKKFNSVYNSLMDYTLHFAKAVLLVVDDVGLANRDIQHLISILGEKFSPSNCVFAISKCDLKTEQEAEQLKETLLKECLGQGLEIGKNQIVCTKGEASNEWHEQLMSCIEYNIDYTASKKNYEFFRPMAEEIRRCAVKIKDELTIKESSIQINDKPEWYTPMKTALENERKEIKKFLEEKCKEEKIRVNECFISKFDGIDKKHKTDKKFLFIHKKESEKLEDRVIIKQVAEECLGVSGTPSRTQFIENIKTSIMDETRGNYETLANNYWETSMANLANTPENKDIDKAKNKIFESNKAIIAAMLDPAYERPNIVKGEFAGYEQIANMLAYEFTTYYYGMIANYDGQFDRIHSYDSVERVAKNLKKVSKKNGALGMIAAIDMLDGTPDMANAFVGIGEAFGIEAAMPYVAAALAVSAVATLGVNVYNNVIEQQNVLCRTWGYALQNAVEEQKESLLDVYDIACDKLLKYICDVHKARERIDDGMYRLNNAKYAASNLIHLVADIDSQYAKKLENS